MRKARFALGVLFMALVLISLWGMGMLCAYRIVYDVYPQSIDTLNAASESVWAFVWDMIAAAMLIQGDGGVELPVAFAYALIVWGGLAAATDFWGDRDRARKAQGRRERTALARQIVYENAVNGISHSALAKYRSELAPKPTPEEILIAALKAQGFTFQRKGDRNGG